MQKLLGKQFSLLRSESPGLGVMGGDSLSRGCGFEFQHRILDGHVSPYLVLKIVKFV